MTTGNPAAIFNFIVMASLYLATSITEPSTWLLQSINTPETSVLP